MDVSKLFQIRTDSLARSLFFTGIILAYVVSLNPWFAWKLTSVWYLFSALCLICSMRLSVAWGMSLFNRRTFLLPWLAAIILLYYQLWATEAPASTYIGSLFHVVIFLSIFRTNTNLFSEVSTKLAKLMALFLLPSMGAFLLYLLGFPLPHSDIEHPSGNYAFTNYYLFLLDDRFMSDLIPRFHSIVLEPGHIGAALAVLLMSQCGRLKKWYNIVLMVATFISFSLAAYILFFVGTFLIQWMQNRPVMKWVLAALFVVSVSSVVVVNYNGGDNMINNLIVLRMEMDDGKLAGDNRVSDTFMKDYESIWGSTDVFFGRGAYVVDDAHGNSGYKRFIYEKGLFGVLLAAVYFISALMYARHRRALMSAFIIAVLLFIVRADATAYFDFLGVYMIAYQFDKEECVAYGDV